MCCETKPPEHYDQTDPGHYGRAGTEEETCPLSLCLHTRHTVPRATSKYNPG